MGRCAVLRDRWELTWREAAVVVSKEWLDGYLGPDAVLKACQRVQAAIKAGRQARYWWTPARERLMTELRKHGAHGESRVKANEALARFVAARGRTSSTASTPARVGKNGAATLLKTSFCRRRILAP